MRVKVGDKWHESGPGKPIMVQLAKQDRKNIANMIPGADRYAVFREDDPAFLTTASKLAWMDDGYAYEGGAHAEGEHLSLKRIRPRARPGNP